MCVCFHPQALHIWSLGFVLSENKNEDDALLLIEVSNMTTTNEKYRSELYMQSAYIVICRWKSPSFFPTRGFKKAFFIGGGQKSYNFMKGRMYYFTGYLLFCWSIVCLSFVSGQQKPRTITIDGGWSPWSTVATPCLRKNLKGILVPVTCGGGQRERKRSCTNPVPQVCS